MSDVQPPDDAPTFGGTAPATVKPATAFRLAYTERCRQCQGRGTVAGEVCPTCAGNGTGEIKTDTWHAYTDRPLAVMETLTTDVFVDDGRGGKIYNAASLLRFFGAVIVEDETDAFMRRMHDKTVVVDINDLGSAMEWLGKRMVGRPLDRPVPSSGGTPGTGHGVTAGGGRLE